jgi:hypothetical protein
VNDPDTATISTNVSGSQGTEPVTQEVRFAIVMYGGVSLAVYIHGVAQELLRLVRATSGADISDDPVAGIYREISYQVRDIRKCAAYGPISVPP